MSIQTGLLAAGSRRRTPPLAAIVAGTVLLLLLLMALLPSVITDLDPLGTDTGASQLPPGPGHPFGTDRLGRDMFSRVVHGAQISLTFGFVATVIAVVAGTVIGVASGLAPRWIDNVVQRVLEVLVALPELLIALVVIAILGQGTTNLVLAITLAAIPVYARIVRASTMQVKGAAFVEAAAALGQSRPAIIVKHILPNVVGPLLVLATIGVGTAIISGAGLSFLGLGPASPSPEWGLMLSDGRGSLATAWWVAVFPGLAITVTVIATTVVGRYLQSRFEGRAS